MKAYVRTTHLDELPKVDFEQTLGEPNVGILMLTPGILEWLIQNLPERDLVTQRLRELRVAARDNLWERMS